MSYKDPYGGDVLADNSVGGIGGAKRLAESYKKIGAGNGLELVHRSSGIRGKVHKFTGELVILQDVKGGRHTFENHPGAFTHRGETVTLVKPAVAAPKTAVTKTSAAGGVVAMNPTARVARASRLWVEGVHDARFMDRVWGEELAEWGIVVEPMGGIDDLVAAVAEFRPSPQRRLAILVDHLVEGTKESRLAAKVRGEDVLVVGHPWVDIWQCVRPKALGIDSWPEVPRGEDWKTGVSRRLGWADPMDGWRRVLSSVDSFADLEPELVGAVETAIDHLIPADELED